MCFRCPEIISCFMLKSHSVLTVQTPVIPPTITDQVRLWELERDRLTFTEGVLYNQFLSQSHFELLRDYAKVCVFVCTCMYQCMDRHGGLVAKASAS